MPDGKPAGVRCVQLNQENRCLIFGLATRPAVCVELRPGLEMCGESNSAAMAFLTALEEQTRPA